MDLRSQSARRDSGKEADGIGRRNSQQVQDEDLLRRVFVWKRFFRRRHSMGGLAIAIVANCPPVFEFATPMDYD